ncbi:(5-formylfuran-3-yl)methyl phosphate synthase [Xanthobacter sp. KR7-225]|uniref:(5-formylfuran-3-yl)methyl phosphate synthase n=1 Tax=Xanthobacter sp. KR7-225 TaxID=3156613 RepID=UPI0032B60051
MSRSLAQAAPGLLASVATLTEMAQAIAGGADIVDLKDPARGALGAWRTADLAAAVVRWRALPPGAPPLSATVGDQPLEPGALAAAAARVAATGVPLVKIGFALGPETGAEALAACLAALAPLARAHRLVGVLFADLRPDLALVPRFAQAGFAGIMLDTADKTAGSLRRHLDDRALAGFLSAARAHGLMSGLAGSLTRADAAPLAALGPHYLGFRGALCATGRTGALDPARLAAVRAALRRAAAA